MGYVADVVREKYPNVLEFVNEVTYLEKAATGERPALYNGASEQGTHYTMEPLSKGHLSYILSYPCLLLTIQ